MVMGYFDDSGTMNQDVVCMAGYLADDQNWGAMTTEWNVLLGKYGIPFLHLAHFRAAENIYAELGWKKEDPRIQEALADFVAAIQRHTIAGAGITLDAVAYRDITKDTKKKERPQVFCFERLLRLLMKRLDEWDWSEPVCLIFDDSKDYAMRCYSSLWEIKTRHPELKKHIAGIAFGDDKYFASLQAVDLFSYATVLGHRYGDGVWSESSVFHGLLLDSDPAYGKLHEGERWDKELLEQHREMIRDICNRPDITISYRKRKPMP